MPCAKLAAVGLHLVSWHSAPMDTGEAYEWLTPGAYLRVECSEQISTQAGVFRNSEGGVSLYGAAVWEPSKLPIFIAAGGASGYRDRNLSPIGGVGVKAGEHVRFMLAPPAPRNGSWLLTAMWEIPF